MEERPVPPLAIFKTPARVMVPELVTGPPDVVRPVDPPETSTELTVPLDPPSPNVEVAIYVNVPFALPTRSCP